MSGLSESTQGKRIVALSVLDPKEWSSGARGGDVRASLRESASKGGK